MRREQVHRLICLRCWCLNGALPFRPEAPPPWMGQDKQRLLRPACPPGLTPAFAPLSPEPPSPCSREGSPFPDSQVLGSAFAAPKGNHFKVPPRPGRHSLPLVRPGRGQEGAGFVSNRPDGKQCPVDVAAAYCGVTGCASRAWQGVGGRRRRCPPNLDHGACGVG